MTRSKCNLCGGDFPLLGALREGRKVVVVRCKTCGARLWASVSRGYRAEAESDLADL